MPFPSVELRSPSGNGTAAVLILIDALSHRDCRAAEALGFTCYADGRALTLPWCSRPVLGAKVRLFKPAAAEAFPTDESEMVTRHAGYGCMAIQVDTPGGSQPFLFRAGRLRGGVPVATLVYCRDMADLVRLAGPLGRFLLLKGLPLVVVEAEAPVAGLSGWFRPGRAPRYCKGPTTPRTGDLTDTEVALFGS